MTTGASSALVDQAATDEDYRILLGSIKLRFIQNTSTPTGEPLFTTTARNLYSIFLANLPPEAQQLHTCRTCARFVDRFGDLVTITPEGETRSAIWDERDARGIYTEPVRAMIRAIEAARVTGVFYSSAQVWGTPETGDWKHFAVWPSAKNVYSNLATTPDQAWAEKREEYRTLVRAIGEDKLTAALLGQVVDLLRAGMISRGEVALGQAEWLANLLASREATKNLSTQERITWRAVATAPSGWAKPRGTVIGPLLESLAAGEPFEAAAAKFRAMLNPKTYQRAQAAPTEGNIAAAEKIIDKLQAAGALARRHARIDELALLWRPSTPSQPEASPGVFGHLRPKTRQAEPLLSNGITTITWVRFRRDILPTLAEIYLLVPRGRSPFGGFLTAQDASAPPILQWDSEGERNPVSWYTYISGSHAVQWGLTPLKYARVMGVSLLPFMWRDEQAFAHQNPGALFILEGAKDSQQPGLGLFPNLLRSELHPIRATIEHFSNAGQLSGQAEASAAGFMIRSNPAHPITLRATTRSGVVQGYTIDRWE